MGMKKIRFYIFGEINQVIAQLYYKLINGIQIARRVHDRCIRKGWIMFDDIYPGDHRIGNDGIREVNGTKDL